MPAVLIRHKVEDVRVWKPVFNENGATRRANGSRVEQIFRGVDDPDEIVVLIEWDDLERARLYAGSDDLRLAMSLSGVTGRPVIWFLADDDRFPI